MAAPAIPNLNLDSSNSAADQARQTGQSAISSFNPTDTVNSGLNRFDSMLNNQSNQTANFTKQYADTVANNPSVTSLYDTANKQFNVPGLANTANYYQNQVTNAIPNGYQSAKGTDISNAQVQNGVANKLAYVTPQSNAATNNLNTAEGLASNYVQAGQAQNTQNLLPIQAQQQFLAQQQAAQQTGYTTEMTNELNGLIAKMQSGVQLSAQEMDRANTLAQQETAYQTALNEANINNQYLSVPSTNSLVNTFSKNVINPGMLSSKNGYYQGT